MQRRTGPESDARAAPAAELSRRIGVLAAIARKMALILGQEQADAARTVVQIARVQIDLERAVARIMEAERAWNDWNNRPGGAGDHPAAGGEIDFDAVRHEIGCRLARLRECCRSD
jgi:hypothetical protein